MEPRASGLLGQCSTLSYILLLSVRTAICPHPLLTMISAISVMPLGNQKPQPHTGPSILTAQAPPSLTSYLTASLTSNAPFLLPVPYPCPQHVVGTVRVCGNHAPRGALLRPPSAEAQSVMLLLPSLPNSEQRNILGAFPSIVGLTPSNYLPEVAGFAFGPVRQPVYSVPLQTTPPGPRLRSVY